MRKQLIHQNRKLSYQILGENHALPLVLVHGFCEDASVWRLLIDDLSKTYKVILPDLPGFGGSESWFDMSIEDMAWSLKAIIEDAAVYNPVIIGHSMGGYVALSYTKLFENASSGLGLFHSTSKPDSEEKKENRLKTAAFIQDNGTSAFSKVLIPTLYASEFATNKMIEDAVQIGSACTIDGLVHATLAMRKRSDSTQVLEKYIQPVLIVAGRFDAGIPVETSAYQASLPQICTFEILEKSGHSGMIEQPKESIQIIRNFLTTCYPNNIQ